jgi:hypothetical protein
MTTETKPATEAKAVTPKTAKPAPAEKNGIRAPRAGGLCDKAWAVCDKLHTELKRVPFVGECVAAGEKAKLNPGNVRAEYGRWRKFHGHAIPTKPAPAK